MATLTALVTVYHGNDPDHLQQSLDSLAHQTRPADEVLIVVDGPVPPRVAETVRGFVDKQGARSLWLSENVGSGRASQVGLEHARGDFLARQDADDVSLPQRFEVQMEYLERTGVDVLGAAVEEFGDRSAIRRMPRTHGEILRYARINSPINNPSMVVRTAAARAVGYRDIHHMEDYSLFARLLGAGYRAANLDEPLVRFRVDDAQFGRRTDAAMFRAECLMQKTLVDASLISPPRALINLAVRTTYRLLPLTVLRRVYGFVFH